MQNALSACLDCRIPSPLSTQPPPAGRGGPAKPKLARQTIPTRAISWGARGPGALEWHQHLLAAQAYAAADDIVSAVFRMLVRMIQLDRAKALPRHSIATLEGFHKAVAQGNLANMLRGSRHDRVHPEKKKKEVVQCLARRMGTDERTAEAWLDGWIETLTGPP